MKRMLGVTLLELMIVIAILAILAGIAYPSYQRYVLEANRTNAQGELAKLQLAQETYRVKNNSFATLAQLGGLTSDHYTYSISNITASSYTLQAVAKGSQSNDTGCTTLTLDHNDNKTPASCWKN
ncbi:type IV pilin protein [Gallaecimonas xiamenensis]|uniref:Pilus assembly protein n=1 Tax=Gallaecimonas xiamenensis 3-C-1 TaxID=745411 RepID=K2J0E3_9GAMM|nr:type IV pilin protein [Gallaecimonas xiamenensis]EKE68262.1 pilus assembly protein [Gallaecimonas xiamenensis 3-C-1]